MKTSDTLLGLDLGTSHLKACLFERDSGRPVVCAGTRLPVRLLENGGREQDVSAILSILKRMVRKLKQASSGGWRRVRGVGVASQGGSSIIVSPDGAPLTPMMLWNDARAHAMNARVLEALPPRFWRKLTLRDVPPHGMARILWLQRYRSELFSGSGGKVMHAGAGDYLFFALTGIWRQDAGSAIQIGPYDARRQCLDERPLKALGLALDFVPPLREGHTTCPLSVSGAALLALPAGTPVAGPYIDQEAGYRSAAVAVDAPLQVSLGTAWVGNFQIEETKSGESPYQLVLPADVPGQRLVVLPLLTGNATWEWAVREFAGGDGAKALAKANAILTRRPLPHAGLHLLPWNSQENPLIPGAHGGGMFIGMNANTSKDDLLSATAACLAFELGRVFAQLRDSGVIKNVVLTGGASNSEHFRRLIAVLMSPLPVWQANGDLSGSHGALHAFGCTLPRTALERVPLPGVEFQREARACFAEYQELLHKLYGHVKAGRPYTLAHA